MVLTTAPKCPEVGDSISFLSVFSAKDRAPLSLCGTAFEHAPGPVTRRGLASWYLVKRDLRGAAS